MPDTIPSIFPDPDLLIELAPEDLAPVVLRLAYESLQRDLIHPEAILQQVDGRLGDEGTSYPYQKKVAAKNALNLAWHWLVRNGLLIPEPGMNGANGHHQLTPKGRDLAKSGNFESFKQASAFPKALLHPSIANSVWIELARGEFDTAVFKALRAVEEAVRAAGKYGPTDLGVQLMRDAFHPTNGRLTDLSIPIQEREGVAAMFAGVIGYYKNPQSHRTVSVDPGAAREVLMIASNLLRIVDERRPK